MHYNKSKILYILSLMLLSRILLKGLLLCPL
ncbi:hypothetical protein HH_0965 [Helicobacter hepaticus ATCC 51449]|uniref:Uncharacterized protein n=1 Tax=Helicobacter hepaticus (strain ATCC 51449 / 3B1) TaxID=235279 RepID=Q7VHK2_HELHP|nr:hypothetical protein HH_0965 [Helicobacter hepaticus ATCC 51449]